MRLKQFDQYAPTSRKREGEKEKIRETLQKAPVAWFLNLQGLSYIPLQATEIRWTSSCLLNSPAGVFRTNIHRRCCPDGPLGRQIGTGSRH